MSTRVPDPKPVGQILGRELDARGWTQADFALVIGRPTQFVSEIVTGKKEITRESAAQIGAALDQEPEYWLRLQDGYLLREQEKNSQTQQELSDVRRRARLNERAPVALLQKRGFLTARSLDDLEAEVADLLGLDSIDAAPALAFAARRSNDTADYLPAQRAWAACVRRQARARSQPEPLSRTKLVELAASLPTLVKTPTGFRDLPARFAEVGVILEYVEAFPGAKIDGCAFMIEQTPVIGISGRGKRLDKVLFTLLHEIAHILLGHVDTETIIETLDEHQEDDSEVAANKKAASWVWTKPLPTPPERITAGWVEAEAAQRGIAPILVVGRLQNDKVLEWRTTLARNAPTVNAVLEGWD